MRKVKLVLIAACVAALGVVGGAAPASASNCQGEDGPRVECEVAGAAARLVCLVLAEASEQVSAIQGGGEACLM